MQAALTATKGNAGAALSCLVRLAAGTQAQQAGGEQASQVLTAIADMLDKELLASEALGTLPVWTVIALLANEPQRLPAVLGAH